MFSFVPPVHDVFGSVRSVTTCAKLLLCCYGSVRSVNIGLILADLHILYATKQNKNHYHQTRFLGLKSGLEVRWYGLVWHTGTSLVGLKAYHHFFMAHALPYRYAMGR